MVDESYATHIIHMTDFPWEMPYYMKMWEAAIRDLCINIPGLELRESDKVFFHERLSEYINMNDNVLGEVQKTLS